MTTLHPAIVGRHSAGSICRTRLWKPTVLSLSTVRSNCCEKIRSMFLRGQGRNAEPCCVAGNVNLRLNSATYSVARNTLAASKVRTGWRRNFGEGPPWEVEKLGLG